LAFVTDAVRSETARGDFQEFRRAGLPAEKWSSLAIDGALEVDENDAPLNISGDNHTIALSLTIDID